MIDFVRSGGRAAAIAMGLALLGSAAQSAPDPTRSWELPGVGQGAESANHSGHAAVRVVGPTSGTATVVPIADLTFQRGVIEVDIVGELAEGAPDGTRGFVGLAFALRDDETYEAFYIRATNGRSDLQLRRNRAVQYISEPHYPWERLRAEHTGEYESYADVLEGAWTHLRIEVDESRARLFVNGAAQPALLIPRLPNAGPEGGGVALWVGLRSVGHFRNLTVTPAD